MALACVHGEYHSYHSVRDMYWRLLTVPSTPINRTSVISGDTTYQICARDTEKRINVILEIINVFRQTRATSQTLTQSGPPPPCASDSTHLKLVIIKIQSPVRR